MDRSVAASLIYAGFWRRKAAYGIDSLLVILLVVIGVIVLGGSAAQAQTDIERLQAAGLISPEAARWLTMASGMVVLPTLEMILLVMILAVAISSVYNIAFVASRWQATPGKHWLGMKVVRADGGPVGIGRSIARHAATGISMGLLSGLGYLTMAFSKEKAALHDLMCRTRVVKR